MAAREPSSGCRPYSKVVVGVFVAEFTIVIEVRCSAEVYWNYSINRHNIYTINEQALLPVR